MKRYFLFILLLTILYYGCKDDAELYRFPYYKLSTEEPVIKDVGVMLLASVDGTSPDVVIERGFVVSRGFGSLNQETYKISLEGEFQMLLDTELYPELECSVYAYMKTANNSYRGESLSFTSGTSRSPVVHSVTLEESYISGVLIIKGEYFPKDKERSKVYQVTPDGYEFECYVRTGSDTGLEVYCYTANTIGDYGLIIKTLGAKDLVIDRAFRVEGPEIVSVSPQNIFPGEIITIEMKGFNKDMQIELWIGDERASIIEQGDNWIKCRCPDGLMDNETAKIYFYVEKPNSDTAIGRLSVSVTVAKPKLWTPIQTGGLGSDESDVIEGNKIALIDNEAYGISGAKLLKFDKVRKLWKAISQLPEDIQERKIIFGQGDYIYLFTDRFYTSENGFLYKYRISDGQWQKSPNQPPVPLFQESDRGAWINNEYYTLTSYVYNVNTLVKYSSGTDTWTIWGNNIDWFSEMVIIENDVYVWRYDKLYEYDIVLLQRGDIAYELPSYAKTDIFGEVLYRNNKIYLSTSLSSNDYKLRYIYRIDIVNGSFKSLGVPGSIFLGYPDFFQGYDYLLPFDERLYMRSKGVLYEYTGED